MPKISALGNEALSLERDDILVVTQGGKSKRITREHLTIEGQNIVFTNISGATIAGKRVISVASGSSLPTSDIYLGDEYYLTTNDTWYKYNGSVWIQI